MALGHGGPLRVFGNDYATRDRSCVRDYVPIDDIADAHLRALDHLNRGGLRDIMNVGNGAGFSVLEVIECARRVTGGTIPYELSPRRAGDPPTLVASVGCAQAAQLAAALHGTGVHRRNRPALWHARPA